MFTRLVRLSMPCLARPQGSFKSITDRIDEGQTATYLINLYSSVNLNKYQKIYLLRSMVDKMNRVSQIQIVFKSQSGREFVKDIVRESLSMAPEAKALVLDLLSKPIYPLRTNLISVPELKNIVYGICEGIDPEAFPLETIKSYKNAAKVGMMNFVLEEKCLSALAKFESDNFNVINSVLEGAYSIPREFSVILANKALKMLKDADLAKLDECEMIRLWVNLGFIKHYFNIKDPICHQLTEKMFNWKYENIRYLFLITSYLKKTASNDRIMLSFLYDKIKENAQNVEFFGGDSIDDTLYNLETLHDNNCNIYMTEKIASDVMNLLIKLNVVKRVGDSELTILLLILNKFSKLTTEAEAYLRQRLNAEDSFAYIKICTCLLLYRNLPELKQEAELMCSQVLNNANFSLASFSIVYILLNSLPKESKVSSVKSLIELIEKMLDSSVNDMAGYKMFWFIYDKSKTGLINSDLWDNYQKKVSRVIIDSASKTNFPLNRKLEVLVSVYNPYLNSYKEWLESGRTLVTAAKANEIYDCVFDKYEILDTVGYIDLVLQRKVLEPPLISHFLSLNVYNPNHRILDKATKMLKEGSTSFLIDRKLKLSKTCLLSQIFKKGYYHKIEDFIHNIHSKNVLKEMDLAKMKVLVTLLGQYAQLKPEFIKILKAIKPSDEIDEVHFFVSLLTAQPDTNLEKVLPKFVEFDETTSLEHLIEKVNLYLNLNNSHPCLKNFKAKVQEEVLRRAERDPMILVDCFEALTTVSKKNQELAEFRELLQRRFREAGVSGVDKNDAARALCCFVDKNADSQLVAMLENHLADYELQNHLVERVIYAYKKNKVVTEYYEKVMNFAFNHFGEKLIEEIAQI